MMDEELRQSVNQIIRDSVKIMNMWGFFSGSFSFFLNNLLLMSFGSKGDRWCYLLLVSLFINQ